METYTVFGNAIVEISMEIEAENKEEAIKKLDKYTAIKSVPPLDAFPYNAITIANPFNIPPNTETSNGSYVIGVTGIKSTKKEFKIIIITE